MARKHDKHHDHCEHEVAHCGKCDLAYCTKCSKEWGAECKLQHYPYYYWWGDTNVLKTTPHYPYSTMTTANDHSSLVMGSHASHS